MNRFNYYILSLVFLSFVNISQAQEMLSQEEAVNIALQNNYDIRIMDNNLEIAENNSSIYNSGYLPTLNTQGGANYQDTQTDSEFINGEEFLSNTQSRNYNGSVGLNYTLFDGFGRKYNYKRLQEQYNLTDIQAKEVIEISVLQLLTSYYEVARLSQNKSNQEKSLQISKDRLIREKYNYEYGQNTQLDVLNSEVDVNNDSILLLNTERQLANAKRDLNVVLGRGVNTDFTVDTIVDYNIGLNYDALMTSALKDNKALQQAEKQIELSNFDLKISQSPLFPFINLNGGYNWSNTNNDTDVGNAFSIINRTSQGLQAGVTLSWNIFDGGATKTRVQNAKIAIDNSNIQAEQIKQDLERNFSNAWETYQNALFILQAEEKNVETNKRNFERSEEQFKLGQIISIEFRLAQTNYLNAVTNYNLAKYSAKVAELNVLQISGQLIGTNY